MDPRATPPGALGRGLRSMLAPARHRWYRWGSTSVPHRNGGSRRPHRRSADGTAGGATAGPRNDPRRSVGVGDAVRGVVCGWFALRSTYDSASRSSWTRPAGEDEQDEARREEHADERVELGRAGQEHREEPEKDADRVDEQDGLAMASPMSSSRWWRCPRSGENGDRPWASRRTMIQNASMIGTPRISIATATLAVPRIDRPPACSRETSRRPSPRRSSPGGSSSAGTRAAPRRG